MKILFSLLLCFLFLAGDAAFAGNDNLVVNYPAPSGSYNKVVLQSFQGSASSICATVGNAGLLFYDTTTGTLQTCTNDGSGNSVPYPELCFNRYTSITVSHGAAAPTPPPTGTGCPPASTCPQGFAPAQNADSSVILDIVLTSSTINGDYYMCSAVCCSASSKVLPSP